MHLPGRDDPGSKERGVLFCGSRGNDHLRGPDGAGGKGGLFLRLQEAPFLLDFRQLVQKFAERFSFKTFWEERNAFFERLFQFH